MNFRQQGCKRGGWNRSDRDMPVAPQGSQPGEANQSAFAECAAVCSQNSKQDLIQYVCAFIQYG